MSRRDGRIVAWHEVPGTTPPQKSRPVGYGVIRPGVRADRSAGISNTKTEKFMLYDLFQQTVYDIEPQLEYHRTPTFQEEHLALRNTSHISMRIPLGSLCPIIPYPTGRFFRGGAVRGTSCQATIAPSLWDISPQALMEESPRALPDDHQVNPVHNPTLFPLLPSVQIFFSFFC